MNTAQTILRLLLVVACSVSGYLLASHLPITHTLGIWIKWVGALVGFIFALLALSIEKIIKKAPLKVIFGGTFGLFLGLVIAQLLGYAFSGLQNSAVRISISVILSCVFGYMGLVLGGKKVEEFRWPGWGFFAKGSQKKDGGKILDTSVIIDGRVADICETDFLEGPLVIPQFILQELQHIADSADSLKRARGRRGLDILNRMQKGDTVEVKVVDDDYPDIKEVDAKLIALAREMNAKIVTNDFNLNKVAQLQGVPVLNINQLANALKPMVLPGEVLHLQIMREGKEQGQGVAYLDDGTMVVVENASRHLGEEVEASVTSILQTTAGRMIFTTLKEEQRQRRH
ncbi:MAG: PIN domain-containing protein [Deltaproteobacteria bacterium]|nr:PIN domain-containing protein [Deltaproteobacteria bacterium]MDH3803616.1 PIN domain-containing protein [Deltaproteobacteria bacterium]MDH3852475.1 PIN domain-containing protein [Deltaproteobacteria bacterium]MDH3897400.1 PIN domain-containing protein [Deltaproteobacteria bacterium]MDH3930532.1 PIN domain-containing protein [Deltaproteobacteria bacterium]